MYTLYFVTMTGNHQGSTSYLILFPISIVIPEILPQQGSVQFVNEGMVTAFICSASGIPVPEITWLRDGLPFDQNTEPDRIALHDPHIIEPSTAGDVYHVVRTLTIDDTRDSDSGHYSCVAANGNVVQPNTTFTFELFVRGTYDNVIYTGLSELLYNVQVLYPLDSMTSIRIW